MTTAEDDTGTDVLCLIPEAALLRLSARRQLSQADCDMLLQQHYRAFETTLAESLRSTEPIWWPDQFALDRRRLVTLTPEAVAQRVRIARRTMAAT